jgi:opacity protein-like surface antigen
VSQTTARKSTTKWARLIAATTAALVLLVGAARDARAQEGFISPFVGYDFGGDSSCAKVSPCEDKRLNAGFTLGVTGNVFGFEEEFAWAKDFFGTAPNISSSVFTAMSNAMLIPNIGPVRPYLLAGLGLIKTHVELSPSSLLTLDNNNFGWDVGGGLIVNFAPHLGVRGDIRYFHSFQNLDFPVLPITVSGEKIDFGRASGAVVFRF